MRKRVITAHMIPARTPKTIEQIRRNSKNIGYVEKCYHFAIFSLAFLFVCVLFAIRNKIQYDPL